MSLEYLLLCGPSGEEDVDEWKDEGAEMSLIIDETVPSTTAPSPSATVAARAEWGVKLLFE